MTVCVCRRLSRRILCSPAGLPQPARAPQHPARPELQLPVQPSCSFLSHSELHRLADLLTSCFAAAALQELHQSSVLARPMLYACLSLQDVTPI